MKTTNNEVVVVTGASAGLGRAIAVEFARHGAQVALLSRNQSRLEACAREVQEAGGRALVIPLDVANAEDVEAAAERVERELGPIDIWVNNAMVSVFSPIKEMRAEEYRRVTEVTYLGYVHGTLAALKRMLPRDRGTIVQVGSALSYRSIPLQSAYCAAKHAINGFTDSLRCELIHDKSNVRVTAVHMPAMNTPQFAWVKSRLPNQPQPVPPIYEPEVGARAVHYAAHHAKREMWVGAPTVVAIAGNKIAPGLGDWYLGSAGYESQQTDEPAPPDRPVNLWESPDGDYGAHGSFGARSKEESPLLWADTHRSFLLSVAGAAIGTAIAVMLRRGRAQSEVAQRVA